MRLGPSLCLWLGLCAGLAPRHAAAAPLLAVLCIEGAEDEALLLRIEGQTVDMAVQILPARGPLAATIEAQMRAAGALARSRGARAVLWVLRLPGGAHGVFVADARGGRLFQQRLEAAGPGVAARSAAAEGAALLFRSVLRALLRGDRLGEPAPALFPPAPMLRPVQTASARLGWHIGAGWQGAFDGRSPPGQHGLVLRGGLLRGPLSLSLLGVGGLPIHLRDEIADVELSRHQIAIQAAYCRPLLRRVCLGAALGLGALFFYRRTEVLIAAAEPKAPQVLPAVLVAPAVLLGIRPRPGLLLSLELGADLVLPTPILGYEGEGGFVERDRLWPLQPRLSLGVSYESG